MSPEEITGLVNEAVRVDAQEHAEDYSHAIVSVTQAADRFRSFMCYCGAAFRPSPEILALAEESADRALELQVERGINDQLRSLVGELADALTVVLDDYGSTCACEICTAARAALRKAGREVAPPGWKINNPDWPSGEGEHLIREEDE